MRVYRVYLGCTWGIRDTPEDVGRVYWGWVSIDTPVHPYTPRRGEHLDAA